MFVSFDTWYYFAPKARLKDNRFHLVINKELDELLKLLSKKRSSLSVLVATRQKVSIDRAFRRKRDNLFGDLKDMKNKIDCLARGEGLYEEDVALFRYFVMELENIQPKKAFRLSSKKIAGKLKKRFGSLPFRLMSKMYSNRFFNFQLQGVISILNIPRYQRTEINVEDFGYEVEDFRTEVVKNLCATSGKKCQTVHREDLEVIYELLEWSNRKSTPLVIVTQPERRHSECFTCLAKYLEDNHKILKSITPRKLR